MQRPSRDVCRVVIWGFPKSIHGDYKRFFRWSMPRFVYAFDASFVNYFGPEGMDAVNDAVDVINDFFVPYDLACILSLTMCFNL